METNSHSKLITIFNDEYIKMIEKEANSNAQLESNINLRKKPNKNMVGRFRKFVSGQKGSDTNVKGATIPYTTTSVSTIQPTDKNEEPVYNNNKSNENGTSKMNFGKVGKLLKDISWWNPPDEDSLTMDFCRDTSLHGLKYIGQSDRHMSERIFWLAAFISGLTLAVVLISDVWNKYNSSPIIVSFQSFETSVDEIPFPAVTVCNMNKVLKSKAEEYIRKAREERSEESLDSIYYLDHVCGATKSFTKRFNYSYGRGDISKDIFGNDEGQAELTKVNEFLRKASQNCSDMIPLCLWRDQEYNCSELFRPIETEFGKCCTFNMIPQSVLYTLRNDERDNPNETEQWHQWNLDNDGLLLSGYQNEFPRRQMQAGKTFGLSFLLNPSLEEYFCTTSDSTGFRLATHLPIDTPHVTDYGISIRPNAEVFINLKPEITMVDSTIFSFNIETRRCYRFGEFTLKYYKFYTTSNCIDECVANATMEVCKCKRYYMPRDESQTLCGGNQTSFNCAENVKFKMTQNGSRGECKYCLPSCSEVDYQSQTTTTPLQTGIWENQQKIPSQWHGESVSIVHIYFGQDTTYARVRKLLFGSTDLFANTGGLMGLCLGFSGLSLMEVLYFLTLRAYFASQRKKNVKNSVAKKFKDAWAKTKTFRFRNGQAVLDKEAETQPLEHSVDSMNLHVSPVYKKKGRNVTEISSQSLDYKTILGDV